MKTILIAALALALAGCGSSDKPDPQAEAIQHIQDISADTDITAIRYLCSPDTQAAPPTEYQHARDDAFTAVHDLIRNDRHDELEQAADILDGCDSELEGIVSDQL